jgi:hypothetical protein
MGYGRPVMNYCGGLEFLDVVARKPEAATGSLAQGGRGHRWTERLAGPRWFVGPEWVNVGQVAARLARLEQAGTMKMILGRFRVEKKESEPGRKEDLGQN